MRLRVVQGARRDFIEAVRWYRSSGATNQARELVEDYNGTIQYARQFPNAGSLVVSRRERPFLIRKYLLHSFPYKLIVACFEHELVVLALAHQKRKPDYWMPRLVKVKPER
ncbi:MAG: hypothetical protein MJD61_01850 [Proteobacteria bacterium]|nr:hypothetical protein [Pseudomonadota bacterium]